MRVAAWLTGHEINTQVTAAVYEGAPAGDCEYWPPCQMTPALLDRSDVHIAYGILRGTADVFRECDRLGKPWLCIDRGYWRPGHYDGYYRIALRGTQQTDLGGIAPDYDRWRALGIELKPWRGFDRSKPVLVCPPTLPVMEFFGLRHWIWDENPDAFDYVLREKGAPNPVDFSDYNYVVTFNSSVGWQAMAAGIPCLSDPTHSIVGAACRNISLDQLAEAQYVDRERLFAVMSTLQLTLKEIRQGALWPLINVLLSNASPPAPRMDADIR